MSNKNCRSANPFNCALYCSDVIFQRCRGNCAAMTLCSASVRIGITLLQTEPSLHAPWTKTIFVLFPGIESNESDIIEVSFSRLANPVNLIGAKLVISRTPEHAKTTDSVCLKAYVISQITNTYL